MSEYIVEVIGQMPNAIYERALEEIVRCRDCKHFPGNCDWCYDDDPDGYCAWSCRRSDKE